MRVRIMFVWPLPFFPHIGETLDFNSLIDDEVKQ